MSNDVTTGKRDEYCKPEITEVKFVVDEAVFAGCKTPSSGGQWDNVCSGTVWGTNVRCSTSGS